MGRAGGVFSAGTPNCQEPGGFSRKALAIRGASGPWAQARRKPKRGLVVVEAVRSSRSGILGGERVNLKLIIQRMDRCQQWLQLLQNCLPFWGAEQRCRTGDVERVQLEAQFSQAHAAGIHSETHNSPQDPDLVGQLATAHKGQGEQDLAGQEAIGGSGSSQPREGSHGAWWWRVHWLKP